MIIEGLKKTYRDGETRVTILDGLDLELEDGGFLALLGRSGSGKSTLLNCVAGIEPADAGSIRLGGEEVVGMSDDRRTVLRRDRIGFVFQFFNLLPILSVRENVALPALLQGRPRQEVLRRADLLLAELELEGRGDERPDHLSGGEQQRVATARALINDPLILLADEPTGNLDAQTALATLQVLRDVNERHGVTILMATHSREAARAAHQVGTLENGRILLGAPVAAVDVTPEVDAPAAGEAPGPEPAGDPNSPEVTAALDKLEEAPTSGSGPDDPGALSAEDLAALQAEAAEADPVENEPLDLGDESGEIAADDRTLEGKPESP